MIELPSAALVNANRELLLCVYTYLAHKATPAVHESLGSIVKALTKANEADTPRPWKPRHIHRLTILQNATAKDPVLAAARLLHLTRSRSGMTAAVFAHPNGDISVVFRGTGRGEWIDNGEGLSGISEDNVYHTYKQDGTILSSVTVNMDFATDQQVEALNWFRMIAAQNNWDDRTRITVSGHSKGGNKAQFVTMHSTLVKECFSFDGQGFSPEALASMKQTLGKAFDANRRRIISLSGNNDYVNVLGERSALPTHVAYCESAMGFHYIESMLELSGHLRPPCEQGMLSRYIESVSAELMTLSPAVRQHAVLAVMNLFQNTIGDGTPVNGDNVSLPQTIAGLAIAVGTVLRQFR